MSLPTAENSRSTSGPKKRRRRKVYGCLGGLGNSKDNEDAKNAKGHFGKDTSKQFSPNDQRYNSGVC